MCKEPSRLDQKQRAIKPTTWLHQPKVRKMLRTAHAQDTVFGRPVIFFARSSTFWTASVISTPRLFVSFSIPPTPWREENFSSHPRVKVDTVRTGPVPDRAAVWTGRQRSGPDRTDQPRGPGFKDRTGGTEARAGPSGPANHYQPRRARVRGQGGRRAHDCGEVGDMHERRRRGGRCAMGSVLCVVAVSHEHFIDVFFRCRQLKRDVHEPMIFCLWALP